MTAQARGILGMAITWGVGLTALATTLLVGGVMLGVVPASIFGVRELVAVAVRAFVVGGGAGALFALVVARRARADNFDTLRLRSFGAWGFAAAAGAAAVLAIGMPGSLPAAILIPSILLAGMLGAGAAAGMLVVARRGVKQVREWREDSSKYLSP